MEKSDSEGWWPGKNFVGEDELLEAMCARGHRVPIRLGEILRRGAVPCAVCSDPDRVDGFMLTRRETECPRCRRRVYGIGVIPTTRNGVIVAGGWLPPIAFWCPDCEPLPRET